MYCLIRHHTIKMHWGSGSIAAHILNLSTRWREPLVPIRLGVPQSWFGCNSEEQNSHHCPCWELSPSHQSIAQSLYRNHFGNRSIDETKILKWILKS